MALAMMTAPYLLSWYYYYYCYPTSTKPQVEILTLNKVNGCNDVSFGDHSVIIIIALQSITLLDTEYVTEVFTCDHWRRNRGHHFCISYCVANNVTDSFFLRYISNIV